MTELGIYVSILLQQKLKKLPASQNELPLTPKNLFLKVRFSINQYRLCNGGNIFWRNDKTFNNNRNKQIQAIKFIPIITLDISKEYIQTVTLNMNAICFAQWYTCMLIPWLSNRPQAWVNWRADLYVNLALHKFLKVQL